MGGKFFGWGGTNWVRLGGIGPDGGGDQDDGGDSPPLIPPPNKTLTCLHQIVKIYVSFYNCASLGESEQDCANLCGIAELWKSV